MPKKGQYDSNSMETAMNEVKNNKLGLRAAAKKYGVPKSTLEFKLKNPGHKETCGPSPILALREELQLVKWIEELANRGFPRKKEDILNSVQQFLIENPRPNPFKNNRPGDCWFKAFLRRHPTIVERTSEAVSNASACVSEADIRKWFGEIQDYLKLKNIDINDPSRIYNGDETGFQICPSTGKVFAGKGVKNVYSIDKGSQKENITVMFSFSASGMTCPPMIIYPYKRIPEKIAVTVNPTWGIGRSDNGWMTSDTFYDYIKNIFHPYLVEKQLQFPVVLFLDGHKSHLTYELSLLCNELNIEVIALYPNATRILQPCDVAVFRPIKVGWKKAVRNYYEQNPGQVLNKLSFAPLLENVVKEVVKPETLINGFKACGLYPFNPDAIDYSKCLGKLNKAIEENNSDPVKMNGKMFSTFVGGDIIARFKSYDTILIQEGFTPEFLALHRMWRYFGNPNGTDNALTQIDTDELRNEPENPKNDDKTTEENENNFNSETDSITMTEPSKSKAVHVFANVVIKKADDSSRTSSPVFITDSNCENSPDIQTMRQETENSELPKTSNVQINNSTTDPIKKASSSSSMGKCIENYLKILDKPQRKNKRQVERVSFAITSRLYQENFEAKKAIKLAEENKKIERKRKREEKAATNLKTKKACKSNDNKINAICSVCKKRLTKSKHWTCNSCHKKFHKFCIPKKHKEHVPDIDDDDLFMCHNCYEEENDEDTAISDESFDDLKNEGDGFSGEQRLKIEKLVNITNNNDCLEGDSKKDSTRADDSHDANLPDENLTETCQEENQERPEIDAFYSVKLVSDDLDDLNPDVELNTESEDQEVDEDKESTEDEDQEVDELLTMYKNTYKKF